MPDFSPEKSRAGTAAQGENANTSPARDGGKFFREFRDAATYSFLRECLPRSPENPRQIARALLLSSQRVYRVIEREPRGNRSPQEKTEEKNLGFKTSPAGRAKPKHSLLLADRYRNGTGESSLKTSSVVARTGTRGVNRVTRCGLTFRFSRQRVNCRSYRDLLARRCLSRPSLSTALNRLHPVAADLFVS